MFVLGILTLCFWKIYSTKFPFSLFLAWVYSASKNKTIFVSDASSNYIHTL
jgi:hypothetical protein